MNVGDDEDPVWRKMLERVEHAGTARFLTFSCQRRLPLFSNDAIKAAFAERLTRSTDRHGVAVLAWVVMPEHVHLIVVPPDGATLDRWLVALKSRHARLCLDRWRGLDAPILARLATPDGPRFWLAGGGHDRNVWGDELYEKIDYCHANPVRRGLSATPEDWPWSSARAYAGRDDYRGPPIRSDLLPRRQK